MFPLLPPTKPRSYDEFLKIRMRELTALQEDGKVLNATTVTAGLLLKANNKPIRDWAAKQGIPKKDFDAALRSHEIINEIGVMPTTPQHLVELVIARDGIQCRFNGVMEQAGKARIADGTKLLDVSADDLSDPSVAALAYFTAPSKITASELTLRLRTMNANLKLGYSDTSIRDAVDTWLLDAKRTRLATIFLKLQHTKVPTFQAERIAASLIKLVADTFDTTEMSAEFVAAILCKFIWSVKRKMRGLPVTSHLMVVLLGPQGVGKTVFVRHFIGPVAELSLEVDFATLEEVRNIEIWRFFVHVLDEMGYATKADAEAIKRLLTADTISRRAMGSNGVETITQNATMIGCANKELDQLINDPTGNRRFAPLRFRQDANWETINTTDFGLIWQSVDEHGPDPMAEHMVALQALQAQSRQLGPVEQWLTSLGDEDTRSLRDGDKIKPELLYENYYRRWEQSYRPGSRPLDFDAWRAEMNRLLKNDKGLWKLPFRRADKRANYGWPFQYETPAQGDTE